MSHHNLTLEKQPVSRVSMACEDTFERQARAATIEFALVEQSVHEDPSSLRLSQ